MANNKAASNFFNGVASRKKEKEKEKETQKQELESAIAEQELRRREAIAEDRRARRETFPEYFKHVAPVIKALESLPPRDGHEFYFRVDLNPKGWDCTTNVKGPEIAIWGFYTNIAGNAAQKAARPSVHGIAMTEKGTDFHDGKSISLEVNELPIFRIRSKPQADGTMKITGEHFTLSYEYCGKNSRGSGLYVYGGDGNQYRECEYVRERKELGGIKDIVEALGVWVTESAPERLDDVAKVLDGIDPKSLEEKIVVSTPLTFKKPARKPR